MNKLTQIPGTDVFSFVLDISADLMAWSCAKSMSLDVVDGLNQFNFKRTALTKIQLIP